MKRDKGSPPDGRFKTLESDEEASEFEPELGPPEIKGSANPQAFLRRFLVSFLESRNPQDRVRRLVTGLAQRSVTALFGDSDAYEVAYTQGFSKYSASLSEAQQEKLNDAFPSIASELLHQAVSDALDSARAEGKAAAIEKAATETQRLLEVQDRLERDLQSQRRRFQMRKNKIGYLVLFVALLLGSVGFTVWLVGLLDPGVADVTIEYNIGELIAAILGGSGVAAAGVAYAVKALRTADEGTEREV